MEQNSSKSAAKKEQPFDDVLNVLSGFKNQITGLIKQVKSLEKSCNKRMKALEKEAKKNKMKGNRKPSGFAVPGKISSELCKFMNKPEGSDAARTEVTKFIIKYIQEKNLQNPVNKREILPDSDLKKLLKGTEKEPVTYFSIQRLMNPHFV
jgi:upstream activation factor subunit UAF30|uniref:DM2 domain-containing protein n=1 Tax=viral metagenome TaxID=1070528 RepID=A0A6C0IPH6_9ZZZZ